MKKQNRIYKVFTSDPIISTDEKHFKTKSSAEAYIKKLEEAGDLLGLHVTSDNENDSANVYLLEYILE